MQLQPMKLLLKQPGSKRLKLKDYELLSSYAVNFNLRGYSKAFLVAAALKQLDFLSLIESRGADLYGGAALEAGAYTRPLFSSA